MHLSPWPALRPSYVIRHAYSLHNVALSVRNTASSISGLFFHGLQLTLLVTGACAAPDFYRFTLRNATQMTIFGGRFPTALQGWKYFYRQKGELVEPARQPSKREHGAWGGSEFEI